MNLTSKPIIPRGGFIITKPKPSETISCSMEYVWQKFSQDNFPPPYSNCWFIRRGEVHKGQYIPSNGVPEHFLCQNGDEKQIWIISSEQIIYWMLYFAPLPPNLINENME